MKVKVYYQDFKMNATVFTDQVVFKPKEAVFMGELYHYEEDGQISTDKIKIAHFCFYSFNVGQGKRSITKEMAEKAGHTSMSKGDYVEFEDGDVLICCTIGWKEIHSWNIYHLYTGEKYTENSKMVTEAITKVLDDLVTTVEPDGENMAFSWEEVFCAAEKIGMLKYANVGVMDTASREAICGELEKKLRDKSVSEKGIKLISDGFYNEFYN